MTTVKCVECGSHKIVKAYRQVVEYRMVQVFRLEWDWARAKSAKEEVAELIRTYCLSCKKDVEVVDDIQ